MKRVSIVELRELTEQALNRAKALHTDVLLPDQKDNPQVRDIRLKNDGVIDTLETFMRALQGDLVLLKIAAGK